MTNCPGLRLHHLQVRSLQLSLEALEQCLDGADLTRQLAALEVSLRGLQADQSDGGRRRLWCLLSDGKGLRQPSPLV